MNDSENVVGIFSEPIQVRNSTPCSMIEEIRELIADFKSFNVQWIPSHCGLAGNEHADRLASHAMQSLHEEWAKYVSAHPGKSPPILNKMNIKITMTMANRHTALQCHAAHGRRWSEEKAGRHLFELKPVPSYTTGLLDRTPRATRRALTRLRHDQANLNRYMSQHLSNRGQIIESECPFANEHKDCDESEERRHYLLHCKQRTHARSEFERTIGSDPRSDDVIRLQYMLALHPDQRVEDKTKAIDALHKYLSRTGYYQRRQLSGRRADDRSSAHGTE